MPIALFESQYVAILTMPGRLIDQIELLSVQVRTEVYEAWLGLLRLPSKRLPDWPEPIIGGAGPVSGQASWRERPRSRVGSQVEGLPE